MVAIPRIGGDSDRRLTGEATVFLENLTRRSKKINFCDSRDFLGLPRGIDIPAIAIVISFRRVNLHVSNHLRFEAKRVRFELKLYFSADESLYYRKGSGYKAVNSFGTITSIANAVFNFSRSRATVKFIVPRPHRIKVQSLIYEISGGTLEQL